MLHSLTARPTDDSTLVADFSIESLPGNPINVSEYVTLRPNRLIFTPQNYSSEATITVNSQREGPEPFFAPWTKPLLPWARPLDLKEQSHRCSACGVLHPGSRGQQYVVRVLYPPPLTQICCICFGGLLVQRCVGLADTAVHRHRDDVVLLLG